MKMTVLLGSPRAQGNTDIIASKIADGARDAGLGVETFALRQMNIHPCIGCDKCWQNDKPCVFEDDMQKIYESVNSADILLFATPVYWYSCTTFMKAVLDRFYALCWPKGKPYINGKRAVLAIAYEEKGTAAAEPILRMFEMGFAYLKLTTVGKIVADGLGRKGAVLDKPEILEQAYQLGLSLRTSKEE